MIRSSLLIAFDGTHASGKTTLIYSVAAQLKQMGINCQILPEPARNSPLVDDVVLRDIGNFDIPLELDLIASHIMQCTRATRNSSLILSDRTPINVLAYTNLLCKPNNEMESKLLENVSSFVNTWMHYYDLIFYCQDYFSPNHKNDKMRSKVEDIQAEVDEQNRILYESSKINIEFLPRDLSLLDRTSAVINTIKKKNLI